MEEMKFWTPKNNEWNNFAIYKDSKEVMRGSITTCSVLNKIAISLKGYSDLTKSQIYEIVNKFKKEFIEIERSKNITMECEIKITIWINNNWFEI